MSCKTRTKHRTWKERALSLLLAAVLLAGMAPGLALPASAEHWAQGYLDQLVDWGALRADQTGNPDAPLTRAEFMAIVNRAYGYEETGPIPFTDVAPHDWFYDDVAIAYTAGYMNGTTPSTAEPNATLTRETALCILGRNMMLRESSGELLAFTDGRAVGSWAKGMVKTAVENGIIGGYPDNTFRPQAALSKAEMAALVTRCVGTRVGTPGTHELGGVFGDVTIASPGVTLRNTTISGNLYIAGGVGMGSIKLENVNVLGRIVISGSSESEGGDASVIMRNVNANEMLVDNMRNRYVTVRADGITEIKETVVRTNAYLEDNNTDDKGLLHITLDGEAGTTLDLAGRIKTVLDKTPNSVIKVAKGTVQRITMDEKATNSVIQLERNTEVKEINLDVATNVVGDGDVGKLNVNAPGSTVTMLPDKIYIRPGITANIAGVVMDHQAAEEGSLAPRLLSGYPKAADVAPTAFRAEFSTNKRGTVYWAVSNITDGSISADHLITPPSYGSRALRSGSVAVPAGDTVVTAQVTGLTVGGSYYLSAVMVDGQGNRSPVKVISFTTPDNTVPAFAQGYPYMSLITDTMAQVTVMPTKSCKLYYTVLPRGAQAPTVDEMRSASVTGNLGYGIVDVIKNTERVINVSNRLEELKDYTLYLWLTDADGANSSAVIPVQFKTVDATPPEFKPHPNPNNAVSEATTIRLTAGLSEAGTIYWVLVPKGRDYPPVNPENPEDNVTDGEGKPISSNLESEFAKFQVKNHRNATLYGSVRVANADNEVNIDLTRLTEATAYDMYYLAEDTAGNMSRVWKITVQTRDTVGPVVNLRYSDHKNNSPTVDSEIILEFNESISVGNTGDLLELYKDENTRAQALKAIEDNFALYWISGTDTPKVKSVKTDADKVNESTWVDYSKVTVRASEEKEGAIEVVFAPARGAIKMSSGTQYYFELRNVKDLIGNSPKGKTPATPILILNPTTCKDTDHNLPIFETVFAWVNLDTHSDPPTPAPEYRGSTESGKNENDKAHARVDASFMMKPQSTQSANDTTRYDLLVLAKGDIDYDLYYRILDSKGNAKDGNKTVTEVQMANGYGLTAVRGEAEEAKIKPDANGWVYLGNKTSNKNDMKEWDGMSLGWDMNGANKSLQFPNLNTLGQGLQYEFVITVTKKDTLTSPGLWRGSVDLRAYVVASGGTALRSLMGTKLQPDDIKKFDAGVTGTTGKSIGTYRTEDYVPFQAAFGGTQVPKFTTGPKFTPGASTLKVDFTMEDRGYVYYAIAPKNSALDTEIKMNEAFAGASAGQEIKNSGTGSNPELLWNVITAQTGLAEPFNLKYSVQNDKPSASSIVNDRYQNLRRGVFEYPTGGQPFSRTICQGGNANDMKDFRLEAGVEYYIYMVVTDQTGRASGVYVYNFTTGSAAKPKIGITDEEDGRVTLDTRPGNDPAENVEATLVWRLFNSADATAMLSALGTIKIPAQDDNKVNYKTDFGNREISILTALTTQYNAREAYGDKIPDNAQYGSKFNKFSLFDLFADSTLKFKVDQKIREGDARGSINNGDTATAGANLSSTVTWFPGNGGEQGVNYIILVAGHNSVYDQDATGGTIDDWSTVDSFAAKKDIIKRNMKAPQLQGTNNTVLGGTISGGSGKYSGSVIIEFDENLYWKKATGDTTVYAVQPGNGKPTEDATDSSKNTVGILYDYWGPTSGISTSGTPGTSPAKRFEIKFTDVPTGTITLFPTGAISSKGGNEAKTAITITIKDDVTENNGIKIHDIYAQVTYEGKTQRTAVSTGSI